MTQSFLLVIGGLVLLGLGGELLVRGAVGMAARLGISPLLAGLTIVGFGTSMPELATSVQAALAGKPAIGAQRNVHRRKSGKLPVADPFQVAAVEALDQQGLEAGADLRLAGHAGDIGKLLGVVLQIKQLHDVAARIPDQLEAALPHHAGGVHALKSLAEVRLARGRGNHRAAGAACGHRDVAQAEQRRHHVLQRDEAFVAPVMADAVASRPPHQDHRDAGRAFVHEALGVEPVVAQHVAVIAGEQDDGVVKQLLLAQRADDDPELVVDVRALGVKRTARVGKLVRLQRRPEVHHLLQGWRQCLRLRPLARHRPVDLAAGVALEIVLERHDRGMGIDVGQVPERGPGRVAPLDDAAHLFARPVGRMATLGQVPRPP
ncbi:MAG: hypothetical protein HC861_09840 [Rhodospirillaceae bacterium]|nr:hypothetical protein [Rhodospirillaceae bacterium]